MSTNYKKLGDYIQPVDVRNSDLKVSHLLGLSIEKCFIESIANTIGTDFRPYKIVKKGQFAYGPVTSRNGDKITIALLKEVDICIISSSYSVFEITDTTKLLPEYLMLWFSRPEFDRYARYKSHGSVREIFDWDEMCRVELPVPDIKEQQKIVNTYNTVDHRINLLQQIHEKLEDACFLNYSKLLNDEKDNLISGTIGDYAKVKSGYAFKSEWWINEGCKVIKIGNIINNTVDLESCAKVAKENIEKSKEFYVKTGDLLIAMTGATTGKIGIVPITNEVISVNQRTGKFFLGDNPIEKVPYLFSMMQSNEVIKAITPDGDAGSAQDNLSPDDIQNIEVQYPSQDRIDLFNKMNKPIICEILRNFDEIVKLQKVNKLLISRISGM
ncbi:MAG: restriction endonuclease subunit S [Treponema sp.]|uniref:restriction endonuclease subunit S n=1 Tax=Treponema sp. TaxID=166 RepID=UPI00298E4E4E|nr:restriction endonuclease subunit S [Treponema sp.]MBR5932511.1 restriction endonuclease subunit S [Treponema sp.]